ncbi:MAG: outer membrane beta-barrel protein [Bacteroidales bacterium]|nr:outer membrane beta-barrel protein [Bacteroidales bacterium]
MINDKRNIDNLFKDKLNPYREKPSVHAWTRLEHGLNSGHRKKAMVYIRWAAAGILLLIAFGAGYFFANLNNQDTIVNSTLTAPDNDFLDNKANDMFETDQNFITAFTENNSTQIEKETKPAEHDKIAHEVPDARIIPPVQQASHFNNGSANIQNSRQNVIMVTPEKMDQINFNKETMFTSVSYTENISFRHTEKIIEISSEEIGSIDTPRIEYEYGASGQQKQENLKWAVGAHFAPTYSYRDISANYTSGSSAAISEEDNFNNIEESLLSYSGGINIDYKVNSKWIIQSGFYISQIGQVNNDALKFEQSSKEYILYAINTSTGPINVIFEKVPDNVRKINPPKDTLEAVDVGDVKIIQQFGLFEIPFILKYKLLNKKLSVNLAGGLSPAYLLRDNTYLELGSDRYDIGNASNLNSVIINSSLGVGLEYLFTNKFSVSFEPTFKYSLNPINKNSQFDYHPYYFSLFTGIKYSF